MLDELTHASAVDGKWAEATIADAKTLEDMEPPRYCGQPTGRCLP